MGLSTESLSRQLTGAIGRILRDRKKRRVPLARLTVSTLGPRKRGRDDRGRQFAPVRSMACYERMRSDARPAAPGPPAYGLACAASSDPQPRVATVR